MRTKRRAAGIGALAIALAVVGWIVLHATNKPSLTDQMRKALIEDSVALQQISSTEGKVTLTIRSEGSDQATADDIKAIRRIKNEARKLRFDTVALTIRNTAGHVVYDTETNDLQSLPPFSAAIDTSLQPSAIRGLLSDELIKRNVLGSTITVTKSELSGMFAAIEVVTKPANVLPLIPQLEQWVMELNESEEAGISQYDLYCMDDNRNLLLYLTADLVYRDFEWWQSPMLGTDTWASSPMTTMPHESVNR